MEITYRGIPKKERIWRGRCMECGSTATARQSELTHISTDLLEGEFSWMTCPVCNAGSDSDGHGGMLFYPRTEVNWSRD